MGRSDRSGRVVVRLSFVPDSIASVDPWGNILYKKIEIIFNVFKITVFKFNSAIGFESTVGLGSLPWVNPLGIGRIVQKKLFEAVF